MVWLGWVGGGGKSQYLRFFFEKHGDNNEDRKRSLHRSCFLKQLQQKRMWNLQVLIRLGSLCIIHMMPNARKWALCFMQAAKGQISLCIYPVRLGPSLLLTESTGFVNISMSRDDLKQSMQIHRLIWNSIVCIWQDSFLAFYMTFMYDTSSLCLF